MDPLQSILLGLVQGLTEFFPVSSSGHLLMLQEILGIREEGILFEITVHVATLASVLIFYRRRVGSLMIGALKRSPADLRYAAKLAAATLPAVLAVLVAGDWFEAQFESPPVAGISLIVTGCILWTTRATIRSFRIRPTRASPSGSTSGSGASSGFRSRATMSWRCAERSRRSRIMSSISTGGVDGSSV